MQANQNEQTFEFIYFIKFIPSFQNNIYVFLRTIISFSSMWLFLGSFFFFQQQQQRNPKNFFKIHNKIDPKIITITIANIKYTKKCELFAQLNKPVLVALKENVEINAEVGANCKKIVDTKFNNERFVAVTSIILNKKPET